jgi:glycosyltransferase involved in cell wall biosynthesis
MKLTVLIPCKDERHNIDACIESALLVADEVLVADSGSTDGTLERARERGDCRVIEREFIDYANFKNWALPQASHEWVLLLDADERVTPELAREIRQRLASDPPLDAFVVYRNTFVLGRQLRHSGLSNDKVTRLVRRHLRYADTRVHEHLQVAAERLGQLKARLNHYTVQSFARMFAVQNRYTSWSALDRHGAGRRVAFWQVVAKPPLRFLQTFVLQRGFLDGRMGFVWSVVTAFYAFARLLKQWELDQPESLARHGSSAEALPVTGEKPRRVA